MAHSSMTLDSSGELFLIEKVLLVHKKDYSLFIESFVLWRVLSDDKLAGERPADPPTITVISPLNQNCHCPFKGRLFALTTLARAGSPTNDREDYIGGKHQIYRRLVEIFNEGQTGNYGQ